MIIECPNCHKKYKIDASKMIHDNSAYSTQKGVEFSCSHCNTQWVWSDNIQEESSSSTIQKEFKDYTDLTALRKVSYAHDYVSEFVGNTLRSGEELLTSFTASVQSKNIEILPKRSVQIGRVLKIAASIGGVLCICVGSGIYIKSKIKKSNPTHRMDAHKSTSLEAPPKDIRDPIVREVKYQIQDLGEFQKITIIGELINPNTSAIPVPYLKFMVWGKCPDPKKTEPDKKTNKITPNDSKKIEEPSQKEGKITPDSEHWDRCIIKKWNYEWIQSHVLPKEQVLFETMGRIPKEEKVLQVDIDVDGAQ